VFITLSFPTRSKGLRVNVTRLAYIMYSLEYIFLSKLGLANLKSTVATLTKIQNQPMHLYRTDSTHASVPD